MGGNVKVMDSSGNTRSADKANFRVLNREQFIESFFELFRKLDLVYQKSEGEGLWPPGKLSGLLSSGVIFSGSSSHLFNKKLSDEEFIEHKPIVGDIDITIPGEKLKTLHKLLDSIQGVQLTPQIKYVGQKTTISNDQINAIFAYTFDEDKSPLNVQIDFEAVEYRDDVPSEFVKFARSSDWSDIKTGVKGVFHKNLLKCLAATLSKQQDVVILTPTSPVEPPEKVKVSKVVKPVQLFIFAVSGGPIGGGLRTAAVQQFLSNGEPLLVNGKRAFKMLEPSDSKYYQSKSDIFTLIFGIEPAGNELNLLGTYTGLLQLMQDHLDDRQIEAVYLDFIGKRLYGSGPGLDIYDAEVDKKDKLPAVNVFRKKFPFLSSHDEYLNDLVDEYYKNYKTKMREHRRRLREKLLIAMFTRRLLSR